MGKQVIVRGYGDFNFPDYPSYKENMDEDKVIETIEEYLKTQTICDRSSYIFDIRTGDDAQHLYSYLNGEIR